MIFLLNNHTKREINSISIVHFLKKFSSKIIEKMQIMSLLAIKSGKDFVK